MLSKVASWRSVLAGVVGLAVLAFVLVPVFGDQPATERYRFSMKSTRLLMPQGDKVLSGIAFSAQDTEGWMSFQDEIWKVGFTVVPHFHKKHFEVFYLLDGQVEWTVGGETHLMNPGDVVYVPSNTIHSVHVVGNKDAPVILVYEPVRYEEQIERDNSYSPEQRKDPTIIRELRQADDFNPV